MEGVFRIRLDFLAQAAHVHVDAPRSNKAVRAPYRIEELIPSKYTVGTRSEVIE
jgi:hypothetical protein